MSNPRSLKVPQFEVVRPRRPPASATDLALEPAHARLIDRLVAPSAPPALHSTLVHAYHSPASLNRAQVLMLRLLKISKISIPDSVVGGESRVTRD